MQNQVMLEKVAELLKESGIVTKRATDLAKKLLQDNEELSNQLESIKNTIHTEERQKKIDQIVTHLNDKKLVAKSDMENKVKQLQDASDEFLDDFLKTLDNLKGDTMPKEAAENTISTFEFMHPSINSDSVNEKERPAFADAFK